MKNDHFNVITPTKYAKPTNVGKLQKRFKAFIPDS
jgi:hypothetical protein